jgi:hypothetical protein
MARLLRFTIATFALLFFFYLTTFLMSYLLTMDWAPISF